MQDTSRAEEIAVGTAPLSREEAVSVFARWLAEFIRPIGISRGVYDRGKLERHATTKGNRIEELVLASRTRDVYLIYDYERSRAPVVYSAATILRLPSGGTDLAVVDSAFTWTIICNHEDSVFWGGPLMLWKQTEANQPPDRTRLDAADNLGSPPQT